MAKVVSKKDPKKALDSSKLVQKWKDHKKDSGARLRYIRQFISMGMEEMLYYENSDRVYIKRTFEESYSEIFYIFYDCFYAIESKLKEKMNKNIREELDNVLSLFEAILCILPEKIQSGWQKNCIYRIIVTMLSEMNSIQIRERGMRLFLIWYQILGHRAEKLEEIFRNLVPNVSSMQDQESMYFSSIKFGLPGKVSTESNVLLVAPHTDERKITERKGDERKYLFEALLGQISSLSILILWLDPRDIIRGFEFLFRKFDHYYLRSLFPEFSSDTDLFNPPSALPAVRRFSMRDDDMQSLREAFIEWLVYFNDLQPSRPDGDDHRTDTIGSRNSDDWQISGPATPVPSPSPSPRSPPTLETDESMPVHSGPPLPPETPSMIVQLVRKVLYSNRENVNLVHEGFRQAFLLPPTCSRVIERVMRVYEHWFEKQNESNLPEFLKSPDEGAHPSRNVRAGMQNCIRLYVSHSAHLFLLEFVPPSQSLCTQQFELCRKAIRTYRMIVKHGYSKMEKTTWEQLLQVLLRVTEFLLIRDPSKPRLELTEPEHKLHEVLIETLVITFMRAPQYVAIPDGMWSNFLSVMAQLTDREEAICQWIKTLQILTKLLANYVYKVDLDNLPQEGDRRLGPRKGTRNPAFPPNRDTRSVSFDLCSFQSDVRPALPGQRPATARLSSEELKPRSMSLIHEPAIHDSSSGSRRSTASAVSSPVGGAPPLREDSPSHNSDAEQGAAPDQERSLQRSNSDTSLANMEMKEEQRPTSKDDSYLPSELPPFSEMADSPETEAPLPFANDSSVSNQDGSEDSATSTEANPMDFIKNTFMAVRGIITESADQASKESTPPYHHESGRPGSPSQASDEDYYFPRRRSDTVDMHSINSSESVPYSIVELSGDQKSLQAAFQRARREEEEDRGIVVGGRKKGFTPELAAILWRRMLGALGDINRIREPRLHLLVFEHLEHLWKTLCKIRDYQPAEGCPMVPPLLLFTPWLFDALRLGEAYKKGKLIAYRLLCMIAMRRYEEPLPSEFVVPFLLEMHRALVSNDQCGPDFFSRNMDGRNLLFLDFLHVINYMESNCVTKAPRVELASLLGSLVCYPSHFVSLTAFGVSPELRLVAVPVLTDQVADALLNADSNETVSERARAIVLCGLAIFVYEQLTNQPPHHATSAAIERLLLALKASSPIDLVACQMLRLLCDRTEEMMALDPSLPESVVKALVSLASQQALQENDTVCCAALECLVEWCARLPSDAIEAFLPVVLPELCDVVGRSRMVAPQWALAQLLLLAGHYPMPACRLNEAGEMELNSSVLEHEEAQFFALDDVALVTVIQGSDSGQITAGLGTGTYCRILVRHLAGKHCWDWHQLHATPRFLSRLEEELEDDDDDERASSIPTSRSESPRLFQLADVQAHLPQADSLHPGHTLLDELLSMVSAGAPECHFPLSAELPPTRGTNSSLECSQPTHDTHAPVLPQPPARACPDNFQVARALLHQLGFLSWERRSTFDLLRKDEQLVRHLRQLDNEPYRDTHKVGIVYVAPGQEEKQAILNNTHGSDEFERFLQGVAWEVEPSNHTGFMGGLRADAKHPILYFADATSEMVFHVSTKMGDEEDDVHKWRHIGNDEIHIIWSEHWRDYRRDTLPTSFGDVIIAIYPLPDGLFRVQVNCKQEMPSFGPLFNGAMVPRSILAGLVRATAMNASRALRRIKDFSTFYQSRFNRLQDVIRTHKLRTPFEHFAASVYQPVFSSKVEEFTRNIKVLSAALFKDEASATSSKAVSAKRRFSVL